MLKEYPVQSDNSLFEEQQRNAELDSARKLLMSVHNRTGNKLDVLKESVKVLRTAYQDMKTGWGIGG